MTAADFLARKLRRQPNTWAAIQIRVGIIVARRVPRIASDPRLDAMVERMTRLERYAFNREVAAVQRRRVAESVARLDAATLRIEEIACGYARRVSDPVKREMRSRS